MKSKWGMPVIFLLAFLGIAAWAVATEPNNRDIQVNVPDRVFSPQVHDVWNYIAETCNHQVAVSLDFNQTWWQQSRISDEEFARNVFLIGQTGQICGIRLDLKDLGIVDSDREAFGGMFTPLQMTGYENDDCFWSPRTGFLGTCRFIGFDGDDDDDDDHGQLEGIMFFDKWPQGSTSTCAVLHYDSDGNSIPCPGYIYADTDDE